jgi:hypothetical protein
MPDTKRGGHFAAILPGRHRGTRIRCNPMLDLTPAQWSLLISAASVLLAGAAFGWRLLEWKRGRETRVEVLLFQHYDDQLRLSAGITAINHSDHAVRITDVGFWREWEGRDTTKRRTGGRRTGGRRSGLLIPRHPSDADIPGTIVSRDAGTTWMTAQEMPRYFLDGNKPLKAWVRTSTRLFFESEETTLATTDPITGDAIQWPRPQRPLSMEEKETALRRTRKDDRSEQ